MIGLPLVPVLRIHVRCWRGYRGNRSPTRIRLVSSYPRPGAPRPCVYSHTGKFQGEVWRVVQGRTVEPHPHYGDRTCEKVHYVDHFANLSTDPPVTSGQWNSSYEEVKV